MTTTIESSNDLAVLDGALTEEERAWWLARCKTGAQSTALPLEEFEHTTLWNGVRLWARGMPLINCLLFEIVAGHETEMHQDVGEFVVLYYPESCPGGPLRVQIAGDVRDVEVIANRLVILDCTSVPHQQVVPPKGSTRYSVAFKFRQPPIH